MDSLTCAEDLSDSPSTSANMPLGTQQPKRRSGKLNTQSRAMNQQGKLVLGQLPVNRKRAATTDRLSTEQWTSVLALSDKTIHQDNRCLEGMFTAQNLTTVSGNYFLSVQQHITAKHRQQAAEWLLDVCKEEQCEADVFPLAISYMDRFLCLESILSYNLQTLASVCLFIASKVKAPQPLNATRIAYYTDGGVPVHDILKWEMLVLSKLNWDVSTSTALDFLDQVAARYGSLHVLSASCRNVVHRIQLEEKFAFLVPSMQAAICLLYCAVSSGNHDVIASAEHALFHLLRCNPQMLYAYLGSVERLVNGYTASNGQGDNSPSVLIAPPSSGDYVSPAGSPFHPGLSTVPSVSSYTTPDHHSRASDDSGFNSGFSSPAAFLDLKSHCGVSYGSRRVQRANGALASAMLAPTRNPLEQLDSGLIASFHPSEDDFLRNF